MPPELSSTALKFSFVCPLTAGIHARPASQLAEVANNFRSELVLTNLRNSREANTKSVLSIIAADIRHGDRCSIYSRGPDEQPAHAAVRRFVEETLPLSDLPLAKSYASSHGGIPRVLQAAGVTCCVGSPVSPGIASGKVVRVSAMSLPKAVSQETASNPEEEIARLRLAMTAVRARLRENLADFNSPVRNAVLEADLAIANDVVLTERIEEQVCRGKSAGYAVVETGAYFADVLRHSGSEYIRERAIDVEEISVQILEELYGADLQSPVPALREPSIIVAENLGSQQLLACDQRWLKGIVLEHSGKTSHTLILARAHALPAVVGVKDVRSQFSAGQVIVVDANRGLVISGVSTAVERFYSREKQTLDRQRELSREDLSGAASTQDGKVIDVAANASSEEELNRALQNGADGIGLFRSEMNFLERERPPSEEEEFAIYTQAARLFPEHPVIVRTFDCGGDKSAKYLKLPRETNPFLGYRGVRLYAEHPSLLRTQLRAILRSSAHGRIQVMVPMISSLQEITRFKDELARAKEELERENLAFRSDTRIGIMIEVPSVAFILDQLCGEVDFFSIGTNDLAQYFFAVDRDNSKVIELSDVLHPGFLRFLKQITDDLHAAGKWVGMCGDMASEIRYLPLLLGLELDEISVPPSEIPRLKRAIRQYSAADCNSLLDHVIRCTDATAVGQLLASARPRKSTEPLLSKELILLDSDSRNKEEAMQELVDNFFIAGRTEDRQALENALWAREAVYSTGLGFGFATPHCKTDAVTANSIGVLRFRQPINWGSLDSEPVCMVIFIAMREPQADNDHMQVFSAIFGRTT
ncbi:MAG: phosphoenolpyruvate--protein phosphotransferase [Acidobacteria bacterium]|nr:MAG: phosphoenolpyruvate--protein phosphotransferase [Acidobacteriota bacterium]